MKQLLEKYKRYFPAAFFVGGFLFDLLTLMRIDETFQMIQQFTYLILVGLLMWADESKRIQGWTERGVRHKVWHFRYEALHFFLGTLLSQYCIFYFKSASLWNSFIFMAILATLFVLNDSHKVRGLGATLRFFLFSLCACSYFIYLVPVFWGHIGFFTFLFSLVLSAIFYFCFFYLLSRHEHITSKQLALEVLAPGIVVHVLFLLLYVTRFLPPIPLSAQKMGIYHDIKKAQGEYQLSYDRPWYYFWQSGAQTFVAGPNDKIYCFVSIFAPNSFAERLAMEWWFKEKNGWKKTDSIPIEIAGGRDRGFRGYTQKSRFDPGEWQVRVVTSDEREVSRIYFTVEKDPTKLTHEFKTDKF